MKLLTKLKCSVLYVPGTGSVANDPTNEKVKWLKRHCENVSVLDTQGSWSDDAYLDAYTKLHKEYDYIIGSSLGGYWAQRLAALEGVPFIAINPSEVDTILDYGGLIIQSTHDSVLGEKCQQSIYDIAKDIYAIHRIDSDDHRLNDVSVYEDVLYDFLESFHMCNF